MSDYISELEVHNIGVFNNLKVHFNPSINIIIGGNSTGKTSILRMLTLCMTTRGFDAVRRRVGASTRMSYTQNDKEYKVGVDYDMKHDEIYRENGNPDIANHAYNDEDDFLLWSENCQYKMYAIGAHRYFTYSQIDGMKKEQPTPERYKNYRNNNPQYLETPSLPPIKQWMINRYFMMDKPWATHFKENWNRVKKHLKELSPVG